MTTVAQNRWAELITVEQAVETVGKRIEECPCPSSIPAPPQCDIIESTDYLYRITPVPQRGFNRYMGRVVVFVFIDEAAPAYHPQSGPVALFPWKNDPIFRAEAGASRFDTDLAAYRQLLTDNINLKLSELDTTVIVPGGRNNLRTKMDVIPQGYDDPEEITIEEIYRGDRQYANPWWGEFSGQNPTLSELVDIYRRTRGYVTENAAVSHIFSFIDTSGSMTRATIDPAYTEFIAWLAKHENATFIEEEFASERWLEYITDYMSCILGDVPTNEYPCKQDEPYLFNNNYPYLKLQRYLFDRAKYAELTTRQMLWARSYKASEYNIFLLRDGTLNNVAPTYDCIECHLNGPTIVAIKEGTVGHINYIMNAINRGGILPQRV